MVVDCCNALCFLFISVSVVGIARSISHNLRGSETAETACSAAGYRRKVVPNRFAYRVAATCGRVNL
jgi:hypothetical protein